MRVSPLVVFESSSVLVQKVSEIHSQSLLGPATTVPTGVTLPCGLGSEVALSELTLATRGDEVAASCVRRVGAACWNTY